MHARDIPDASSWTGAQLQRYAADYCSGGSLYDCNVTLYGIPCNVMWLDLSDGNGEWWSIEAYLAEDEPYTVPPEPTPQAALDCARDALLPHAAPDWRDRVIQAANVRSGLQPQLPFGE